MWKAIQTIGDDDERVFEDGSSVVLKKVKGADKTGKILKIGADTGKTLRRRNSLALPDPLRTGAYRLELE